MIKSVEYFTNGIKMVIEKTLEGGIKIQDTVFFKVGSYTLLETKEIKP